MSKVFVTDAENRSYVEIVVAGSHAKGVCLCKSWAAQGTKMMVIAQGMAHVDKEHSGGRR